MPLEGENSARPASQTSSLCYFLFVLPAQEVDSAAFLLFTSAVSRLKGFEGSLLL